MADFYYIDLYFDGRGADIFEIVDACVRGCLKAGAVFQKVVMSDPESRKRISLADHIAFRPEDLGSIAREFLQESATAEFFAFPPLGRIMFHYDFKVDMELQEEITDEEEDSHTHITDLGMAFVYNPHVSAGRQIKASISFWQDYVLSHSRQETHEENRARIIQLLNAIVREASPYFGAMDEELRLNTDRALEGLLSGLPAQGDSGIIAGVALLHHLDAATRAGGISLADGSVLLNFSP